MRILQITKKGGGYEVVVALKGEAGDRREGQQLSKPAASLAAIEIVATLQLHSKVSLFFIFPITLMGYISFLCSNQ